MKCSIIRLPFHRFLHRRLGVERAVLEYHSPIARNHVSPVPVTLRVAVHLRSLTFLRNRSLRATMALPDPDNIDQKTLLSAADANVRSLYLFDYFNYPHDTNDPL